MAAEKSSSKGQAWFCTTGLPSDIVIEVDDMSFHLHKFPLMSKSRKLHLLITEQETRNLSTTRRRTATAETETDRREVRSEEDTKKQEIEIEEEEDSHSESNDDEEIEEEVSLHITLTDFPGGSRTFEIAAKFCYGVKIDITSSNVAPLRCGGEYLEMTEEYAEDNLIAKTERFLSHFVLRNIQESVKTLKSCEKGLMPFAEKLNIPQRCIDSIVGKATESEQLFGWPVNDGSGEERASNQVLWNGIDTGLRRKIGNRFGKTDSWFEDLGFLSLNLFKEVISAMKARDLSSEIIESSLIAYARKSIPGLSRSTRKQSANSLASEAEQREMIETIITNLPLEKSSRSSTQIRHLFGLLRTANILNASEACRAVLEKKIGSQLEKASLDDLLIPSYSYLIETLYDVGCVERILGCFLEDLGERSAIEMEGEDVEGNGVSGRVMKVGKLIDGYLSEIASDANLKPSKFCDLGVALPDQARVYDDGLYRAVDVYLKAHPWIAEEDREKICGVLDCQKLTLEACTHAAQNERLPLRAIVQVLFFEQLQLRHAIAGSLLATDLAPSESARPSILQTQAQQLEEDNMGRELALIPAPVQDSNNTWRAAIRENQVLRFDMDSMRSRVNELERECSTMKKAIEKIDKVVPVGNPGWRSSLTKKFGCKFKTQVCDSQERTVVEAKRGGRLQRQKSLDQWTSMFRMHPS